jgi:hypothetical protein
MMGDGIFTLRGCGAMGTYEAAQNYGLIWSPICLLARSPIFWIIASFNCSKWNTLPPPFFFPRTNPHIVFHFTLFEQKLLLV